MPKKVNTPPKTETQDRIQLLKLGVDWRAGHSQVDRITTQIRWGDSGAARAEEISRLPDWIKAKRREKSTGDKDLIVMGDFNIPSRSDPMFQAITKHGLQIAKALTADQFGSNLEKNKQCDQIPHQPIYPDNFTNAGGVLDFYVDESHIQDLFHAGLTKATFSFQPSDHLPLWLQINTDIKGFKPDEIVQEQAKLSVKTAASGNPRCRQQRAAVRLPIPESLRPRPPPGWRLRSGFS